MMDIEATLCDLNTNCGSFEIYRAEVAVGLSMSKICTALISLFHLQLSVRRILTYDHVAELVFFTEALFIWVGCGEHQ